MRKNLPKSMKNLLAIKIGDKVSALNYFYYIIILGSICPTRDFL